MINTMNALSSFLLYYLIAINSVTFLMFGFDKWMARSNARRTPEKILWLFSLLGGSLGAILGMQTFRHKTKKISFQFILALILIIQAGSIAAWLYFYQ